MTDEPLLVVSGLLLLSVLIVVFVLCILWLIWGIKEYKKDNKLMRKELDEKYKND